MFPASFIPRQPGTDRPTLNLPASTIEKATTTRPARHVLVPLEVPIWLAGHVGALAQASEEGHEKLTKRYGKDVADLLAPNRAPETMAEETSLMLIACSILAGGRNTRDLTKMFFDHHAQTPLHHLGLALSIEINLFSEKLTDHLLRSLGTIIDYGLYHQHSQTFIPVICERGIITTVDYDLFTNPAELAAEAVRLVQAYTDMAGDKGLEPVTRVGFYTHGGDAELGNITQCKVIDTSLF